MTKDLTRSLIVHELQHLPFQTAYERQLELRDDCIGSGGARNHLLLIEHPPTITVGLSGQESDILARADQIQEMGVDVVKTNRGGEVTFHGPGQLVVYPIIDLTPHGRDLHRYLRALERWLTRLCRSYGVRAHADNPHTGVWVADRKIASIGIACRRWVAYHGIALNVDVDLCWFDTIVPCGLRGVRMTSIQQEAGNAPALAEIADRAAELFREHFGYLTATAGAERRA